MPYTHIAAYAVIVLPKARSGPIAVTLWYHHISTFRLCANANALWPLLTYSYPCLSTLQCNVMVPSHQSISVTSWYPAILLWYGSVST